MGNNESITDLDMAGMDNYSLISEGGVPRYMLKKYGHGCCDEIHALETEVRNIKAFHELGIDVPLPVKIDREKKVVIFPYAGVNLSLLSGSPLLRVTKQPSDAQSDIEGIVRQILRRLARIHSLDTETGRISSTVCKGRWLAEYTLPSILGIMRDDESWVFCQMKEAGFKYEDFCRLAEPVWRDAISPSAVCKSDMCHAETVFVGEDGKVTLHNYTNSRRDDPLMEIAMFIGWGIGDDAEAAKRIKRSRLKDEYLPRLTNDRIGIPTETEQVFRAVDLCVLTEMVNEFDVLWNKVIRNDYSDISKGKIKVMCRLAYQNLASPMSTWQDILDLTGMLSEPMRKVLAVCEADAE